MFTQHPYRIRFDWGRRGAREAAERGDGVVVIDVLSFSTAVAAAVQRDIAVYPCPADEDPVALARRIGAEPAVRRGEAPERGRFSLSPRTFDHGEPGARVVLASPNGATCSACAASASAVLAGCLLNATAVSAAVTRLLDATACGVTVVACGERWSDETEDGPLRVAVEDYLGAGAVLAGLNGGKSPVARVCERAFAQARRRPRRAAVGLRQRPPASPRRLPGGRSVRGAARPLRHRAGAARWVLHGRVTGAFERSLDPPPLRTYNERARVPAGSADGQS